MVTRRITVCESCIEAVVDEAAEMGMEMPWDEAEGFARTMGADIADHICDARENGLACGCMCRIHDKPRRIGGRHV